MKLGVSYNIFDGEQLLGYSIRSIREHVDHVNIVYQTISNYGNSAEEGMEATVLELNRTGLADSIFKYEPNLNKNPKWNETKKRDIGLQIARRARCDYFMTSDADEFYKGDEFSEAKKYIRANRIGCSAVKYVNYIRKPIYQIEGTRRSRVPFICKIGWLSRIRFNAYFPVFVDPSRRLSGRKRFHLFDEKAILMHHMVWVGRSIEKKYRDASSTALFPQKTAQLKEIAVGWKFGDPIIYPDDPCPHQVVSVPNVFSIDLDI